MYRTRICQIIDQELNALCPRTFDQLTHPERQALLDRVLTRATSASASESVPAQPIPARQPACCEPCCQPERGPPCACPSDCSTCEFASPAQVRRQRILRQHMSLKSFLTQSQSGLVSRSHKHIERMHPAVYPRWWPRGHYCSNEDRAITPKVTETSPRNHVPRRAYVRSHHCDDSAMCHPDQARSHPRARPQPRPQPVAPPRRPCPQEQPPPRG